MQWIAPSERDQQQVTLEKKLWAAADELRANSGLTAAQYSQPVLELIFLRFADARFSELRKKLEGRLLRGAVRRHVPSGDCCRCSVIR